MSDVRYVRADEIDVDLWDKCIESDAEPLIYNTSWYLDTLGDDWDGLVLGNYEAVMPVTFGRKWGFDYVYRPYGVQQQGISGALASNAEVLNSFLETLAKHYKYCELYLNHQSDTSTLSRDWVQKEQVNLVLPVDRSYEKLYERFSSNTKRNIKKAKKAGFKLFEHDSPEVLVRMFQHNQGKKYKINDAFYAKIQHLMHVLLHKRRGTIWTVHDERNSPVGGLFVMEYKGRATLLFSAVDDYGRDHGAMAFLINEYLIMSSGHLEYFDFEGSNEPGLARFYKGFGADYRNYPFLKYNKLPLPLRWLK